jgi:hypothetical protein
MINAVYLNCFRDRLVGLYNRFDNLTKITDLMLHTF